MDCCKWIEVGKTLLGRLFQGEEVRVNEEEAWRLVQKEARVTQKG